MNVLIVFSAVLAVTFAHSQIKPGSAIHQCKAQNLECPEFKKEDVAEGFEMRMYPASKWVGTTHVGMDMDPNSFNKLFKYITGANEKKMTIDMTAPVLTEIIPGPGPNCESNFTMSFYVPKALWDSAPEPSASDVFLHDMPDVTVYVKAFDGFASSSDYVKAAADLAAAIGDSSKFVQGVWYTGGYDSPFKFWDRRNEVLFIAK